MRRGYSDTNGSGCLDTLKQKAHRIEPSTGRLNHETENGDERADVDWNGDPEREWTGYAVPRSE